MRIGYVNKTMTGTLVASSFAPGMPVINLQNSRMTRKWGSFGSGVSTIEVPGLNKATLGCINAHNAVTGDTIKLKGYTDSARTSLDTTITFSFYEYATAKIFTEKTLYWTFEFTTVSAIEIGGLFLGEDMILPSYEIGHSWSEIAGDESFVSATRQLYGLNPFQYRRASYLLPHTTWEEQIDDISVWWKTVGKSTPFYLLQYPDRQDLRLLFYCHLLNDEMKWQEHEKNIQVYKDLIVNIEEVF